MVHFVYELADINFFNNAQNLLLLYIHKIQTFLLMYMHIIKLFISNTIDIIQSLIEFDDSVISDFIAVLAVSIGIVVPVSIDLLHRMSEKYDTNYLSDLFIKKSKLWWLISVGIIEIVLFVIIKSLNQVWYVELSGYIAFFIFIYFLICFFRACYLHLLPLDKIIRRIIKSNAENIEKLIKKVEEE
ncbi:MAG: hypothetical protein C4541_04980 [Candidatus Auribacter fodinae]|jgi:hypothetical protein|uniref:Uncharacterized protein n=1 Tax=Candidatus Auribacter fodinae TaxID=2093366 RepID=A0A3A4R4U1_9BACT|nr:MAG: hypothetical protein C4541_04980 [Candidatus Auribacter fodinae]